MTFALTEVGFRRPLVLRAFGEGWPTQSKLMNSLRVCCLRVGQDSTCADQCRATVSNGPSHPGARGAKGKVLVIVELGRCSARLREACKLSDIILSSKARLWLKSSTVEQLQARWWFENPKGSNIWHSSALYSHKR